MTQEKRKRGRPKGSGKKGKIIKEIIDNIEYIKPIVLDDPKLDAAIEDEPPQWVKPFFDNNPDALVKTKNISTEKLIPPAGLSKTDTLKWLTANKK